MSERRKSPTVTSGQSSADDKRRDSGRPPPGRVDGQQKLAQRHFSADDTGAAAAGGYDDEMSTPKGQRRSGRLKLQQSADSSTSGASSDSTSKSFKTIFNRAIRKLSLPLRRSRSAEYSKSPPNTDAEATGEVDPVYRFLKLTSVMPLEGTSVIPGDDHYCCSRTDQDIGVGADNAAATDPARCQCPCHLPERLQTVHNAFIRSFSTKKT